MSVQEIEGEIVEEHTGALVPISRGHQLAVTPDVSAGDLVRRLDVIRDAMTNAMQDDVDYGVIPGTDKPTLLKPGAEKLSVLFQLDVQLENEKTWLPGDHLVVSSKATVFHAPSGARLGYGEGLCSTREAKYAFRNANRKCPACGAEAIIKGKAEYGGGWVCFKKKNGCGAKFADDDAAITNQAVGQIDNPALPDLWNTVVKMAEKRARVDAVLAVTGASALFTQDAEPVPAEPTSTEETATFRAPESVRHETSYDSPADTRVHFGKNVGVRLGDLTANQLRWYAETWEPGGMEQDERLKHDAVALLLEGAAE